MSVVQRVLSGAAADFLGIPLGVLVQLVSIPVYVNHWGQVDFGIWLLSQSLVAVFTCLDTGHQNFLAYEFVRLRTPEKISELLGSAIPTAILLAISQVLILLLIVLVGVTAFLAPGADAGTISKFNIVLLIQISVFALTGSVGGVIGRSVVPFGRYAQMAWWRLTLNSASALSPIIATLFGADLVAAAAWAGAANIVVNVGIHLYIFRQWRRFGIRPSHFSASLAMTTLSKSVAITARDLLVLGRQQGLRIVLATLTNLSSMASFSAMRTVSNIATQGVNTITNPMEPEMLRYFWAKDQDRFSSMLAATWMLIVIAVLPTMMWLQLCIEPLFTIWTSGKLNYDGQVVALMSASVIIFSTSQPLISVLRGTNQLRAQLVIAFFGAAAAIGGVFLLTPLLGLRGAAISLTLAESVTLAICTVSLYRWLRGEGLQYPTTSFLWALAGCAVACFAVLVSASYPQVSAFVVAFATIAEVLLAACLWFSVSATIRRGLVASVKHRIWPKVQ